MGAAATAAGSALPPAQLPDDVPGVHVLRASEQTVLPQASRNARSPAPPLNTAGGRVVSILRRLQLIRALKRHQTLCCGSNHEPSV